MGERILVVEDESTLCTNVARYLTRAGHDVTAVETGTAALDAMRARSFDLVITDLRLPDLDGLTILDRARASSSESAVLVMTAYASIDSAVEALRRGAHDYMLKPLSLAELARKVDQIAERRRLGRENARLRTLVRGDSDAMSVLRAGGKAMNELCDVIEKVAASASNVLIVGESGVGKEIVARALHERSPRAEGPFVTVGASTMAEPNVESALFGHERGAFPGADRARDGLFRAASRGTLFLDEIGELPASAQAKLLRAVETKEILPVGADRGLKVDARIVAATHRDLAAMVDAGTFRRDLFYRLQVVQLRVPSLRERIGDVPTLAAQLVAKHARARGIDVRAIAPDAMAILTSHAWPGNVRELSNVIERAVILATGDTIAPIDLPPELGVAPASAPSIPIAGDDEAGLERATLAFQRQHIARVLDRVGSRDAAARVLGLSPATLYRYLQRVGLKGHRVDE